MDDSRSDIDELDYPIVLHGGFLALIEDEARVRARFDKMAFSPYCAPNRFSGGFRGLSKS